MTVATNRTDSAYEMSLQGLRKLHALTVGGQDEADEADRVRTSLERPWQALTPEERARIEGLSPDLYAVSEPAEPRLVCNPQVNAEIQDAETALRQGKFDDALDLYRRCARYIDPAELSFKRAHVWLELGDIDTAKLFFEHPATLRPNNGNSRDPFRHFLCRQKATDEPTSRLDRSRLARTSAETADPAQETKALEEKLSEAIVRSDLEFFDSVLADDFTHQRRIPKHSEIIHSVFGLAAAKSPRPASRSGLADRSPLVLVLSMTVECPTGRACYPVEHNTIRDGGTRCVLEFLTAGLARGLT